MTRVVLLTLGKADVVAQCAASAVGVSVIEQLVGGGVRLVCSSASGAETIRQKLNAYIIDGHVVLDRRRPARRT